MAEIAVLIQTRERDEALFNCLRSVRIHLRRQGFDHRIYLADDGPISEVKAAAYDRLREEGHVVLRFERELYVGQARNILADQLEDEPWVLRTDDDFQLTGETDVAAMRRILEEVPEMGALADLERPMEGGGSPGRISDGQGWFERHGDTLVARPRPPGTFDLEFAGPHRFARCDFTGRMLLIRREVLEDARWDDHMGARHEHDDFLLELASAGWEVAFTPDSVHLRRDDLVLRGGRRGSSGKLRTNGETSRVFEEKWGIRRRTTSRSWRDALRRGLLHLRRALGRSDG